MSENNYDMSIHHNPDARAWARFFKETCDKLGKDCDEEWMVTWFANAMMAMHDYLIPGAAPTILPDGSAFFVTAPPEPRP